MSVIKIGLTLGLIFILNIFFYNFGAGNQEETAVTLKLGKVRGSVLKTYTGKTFFAFRGIPYAKPPIGQLRFKPPEKLTDPWSTQFFDATNDGSACIQFDPLHKTLRGQEDCLVLNVYTSDIPNNARNVEKKAVMVFIHGGGFNYGTGISLSYGPKKLLDHDVVLVTFNYRLNVFGFLSTQDESSPGNYGLLDQVMALKWVQENIEAFGGDSKRVTIFGESAGGASVSYHFLSELSTGLFQSAIVMSGTPLAFWAFDYEPVLRTRKFASLIGCTTSNSNDTVECLRQRSLDEFTKYFHKFGDKSLPLFRPVVDGYFLKEHPITFYKSGEIINRVPLIYGNTKNEGLYPYAVYFGNSIPEISDDIIKKFVTLVYDLYDPNTVENEAINLIKSRYFHSINSTDFEMIRNKLIQVSAEGFIDAPLFYNLEFFLNSGMEPFVYSFDYVTNHSIAKLFGISDESEPTHVDDVYFLFDSQLLFPFDYTKPNDEHEKRFLELFVNFVKTSNPTPENYENSLKWLPAKNGEIVACHLDNPIKLQKLQIDYEMVDFWMKTLFKITKLKNKRKEEL